MYGLILSKIPTALQPTLIPVVQTTGRGYFFVCARVMRQHFYRNRRDLQHFDLIMVNEDVHNTDSRKL